MTATEAKERFTATLNTMHVAAFLYTIKAEAYDTGIGVVRATNANGTTIKAYWHGDDFTEWEMIVPDVGKEGEE